MSGPASSGQQVCTGSAAEIDRLALEHDFAAGRPRATATGRIVHKRPRHL